MSRIPGWLTIIALGFSLALTVNVTAEDGKHKTTALRESKDSFLFGVYHVSWIKNRYEPQRYDDLNIVVSNGLNAMVAGLDPTSYKTNYEFLEKSREKNMGLIAELYMPALGISIDLMKSYPAIIAWQIGDDFNVTNSSNYATPETLKARHLLAKKHDPGHRTYASGGTAICKWYRSFKDYHGCVDMIGMQVYPVGNNVDFLIKDALESSYQLFRTRVDELTGSGIIPVANLQSFSWKEKPALFPTASESRNMLYGALAAGVKGVLYYAFYEGKKINGKMTLAEQCPPLWEEIGKQAVEVKAIESFLKEGSCTQLKTQFDKVHASLWKKADKSLLILFSTERKLSLEIGIILPGSESRKIEAVFKDRPAGMLLSNGIISGNIGPEEVHVYHIKE